MFVVVLFFVGFFLPFLGGGIDGKQLCFLWNDLTCTPSFPFLSVCERVTFLA